MFKSMEVRNKSRFKMSRNYDRKDYYRSDRDRDREWNRSDYNRKRSRSPHTRADDKRRSRSPRKIEKDVIDENILSEISKLPEPSELWDSQMQDGFPPPATQAFQQEGSNYNASYQTYAGIYNEFPSVVPSTPHPPDTASWNQMSLPPPPPAPPIYNVEDQIKKEAAIETEMRHQKAALSKQREDYIKKAGILKKELDTLKDQRNELRGDAKRSPSPDTKRFLKENTKLQLEIQNKLKTINNVVDMLNGIIGEEAQEIVIDSDDSADRSSKRKSRSPSANSKKFNYVYYDPEMHWCRVCNEFPPTAKDYLNHLHSPSHHKMAAAHMEAPWHTVSGVNEGFPNFTSAPTKRTPIRGLQFFVPSTAWYCKLCDQFIGDLHCASAHLKSIVHSKNYTNFVEQNPHWETDWMSDRQKAFEKARANNKIAKVEDKPQQYTAHTITFNKDGFHTKRKVESPPPIAYDKKKKDKKKKSKRKKSSSSSSSSSYSDSDSEPKKKKKSKKTKSKSDDKLSVWMSSIQMDHLNDNDRKLLDNIKTRIKLDKIESSRRSPGRERDRGRSITTPHNTRVQDRRDSHSREDRDRVRDRERREESRRRDERREERRVEEQESERRSPTRQDAKKVKMPFIGKMPVYKNLAKTTKPEEPKKDDTTKKEEDEAGKKRQQEIDAEIQKKVAEFKEKIAKAQLERQQAELPPPILLPAMPALPPHAFMPPPPQQPPPPATTAPPPTLPKDFQDALDIIFPSADKQNADMSQQDQLFSGIPGLGPPGFPGIPGLGGMMQPFPQMSLLGNPPPHLMMGFDMNAPLFNPRHQLYDTHVPLMPNANKRHNQMKNRQNQNKNNNYDKKNNTQNKNTTVAKQNVATTDISATTTGTNATTTGTSAATTGTSSNAASGESNVTSPSAQTTTTTTAATTASLPKTAPTPKNKEELDDLAMLGIDASDVGAGI